MALSTQGTVSVDGFHAVKHALRFGAEFNEIIALDDGDWRRMARELAPDIEATLLDKIRIADANEFKRISKGSHPTGIAGIAIRPNYDMNEAANKLRSSPAVLLENPHRMGNIGATIRVAAATGASSVIVLGSADPWHAEAIRGSAGLHFAQPVISIESLDELMGPIITLDPEGEAIAAVTIPSNAILAFGTEREGVSSALNGRAELKVALPMQPGVSSLNLATSVAATLYSLKLYN